MCKPSSAAMRMQCDDSVTYSADTVSDPAAFGLRGDDFDVITILEYRNPYPLV